MHVRWEGTLPFHFWFPVKKVFTSRQDLHRKWRQRCVVLPHTPPSNYSRAMNFFLQRLLSLIPVQIYDFFNVITARKGRNVKKLR